jgi:hypothetical protein
MEIAQNENVILILIQKQETVITHSYIIAVYTDTL